MLPTMAPLNNTILLPFFLIIKIVFVVCPTNIENCENELYSEFKNVRPLDDFLHAFLNIKFHMVCWDENTDLNEEIYRGNDILKKSARGYYNELFNIALEMGIPELTTPQDFCRTYGREEEDCKIVLAEIGCTTHILGSDCFENMYFRWRKTERNYRSLRGTEDLSDEELLDAIVRGVHRFRNLTDEELFERFTNRYDIIQSLSDENLLQDFLIDHHNREPENARVKRIRRERQRGRGFDGSSGSTANIQYVSDRPSHELLEMGLAMARLKRYGISSASYADICAEYQRRKTLPKLFDNLYAMDICNKLKHSSWDISNFIGRRDFCLKYLSEQQ